MVVFDSSRKNWNIRLLNLLKISFPVKISNLFFTKTSMAFTNTFISIYVQHVNYARMRWCLNVFYKTVIFLAIYIHIGKEFTGWKTLYTDRDNLAVFNVSSKQQCAYLSFSITNALILSANHRGYLMCRSWPPCACISTLQRQQRMISDAW